MCNEQGEQDDRLKPGAERERRRNSGHSCKWNPKRRQCEDHEVPTKLRNGRTDRIAHAVEEADSNRNHTVCNKAKQENPKKICCRDCRAVIDVSADNEPHSVIREECTEGGDRGHHPYDRANA